MICIHYYAVKSYARIDLLVRVGALTDWGQSSGAVSQEFSDIGSCAGPTEAQMGAT
jgi:hypothetical protein